MNDMINPLTDHKQTFPAILPKLKHDTAALFAFGSFCVSLYLFCISYDTNIQTDQLLVSS